MAAILGGTYLLGRIIYHIGYSSGEFPVAALLNYKEEGILTAYHLSLFRISLSHHNPLGEPKKRMPGGILATLSSLGLYGTATYTAIGLLQQTKWEF